MTGVDISHEALDYARKHYSLPHITYIQRPAAEIRTEDPFDVVVSFETIEHLDDYQSFLKAVTGMLSAHGTFLVSTPVRASGTLQDKPPNPFHIREWNVEEFDAVLGQYFETREFFYQYNFRRRSFPGSRTFASVLSSLFYPAGATAVRAFEPAKVFPLPQMAIYKEFMLAVCEHPTR